MEYGSYVPLQETYSKDREIARSIAKPRIQIMRTEWSNSHR